MTIAECKTLESGTPIWFSTGNGWRQEATFLKMVEVTSFGTMSLSDLMRKDFDLGKGRKTQQADIIFMDDSGRERRMTVLPRRITRR